MTIQVIKTPPQPGEAMSRLTERIEQKKAEALVIQNEIKLLEERQTQIDSIPHNEAVHKLREIYIRAEASRDSKGFQAKLGAKEFIQSIITDAQLIKWFGPDPSILANSSEPELRPSATSTPLSLFGTDWSEQLRTLPRKIQTTGPLA